MHAAVLFVNVFFCPLTYVIMQLPARIASRLPRLEMFREYIMKRNKD